MDDVAMAITSKQGESTLKQLRKSFKNVEAASEMWKRTCSASSLSVNSLTNVAEQYHCVLRVAQSQSHKSVLLVKRFPDITLRIQYKLIQEMELIVRKLQSVINEMQSIHTKIHQQCVHAMSTYKKNARHLPLAEITKATSTWPSIADMLEWLWDLDCIFQFLYENQTQVLNSLDYSNEELMQSLPARWQRGNREAEESLQNVMAHISFFMADG